VPTRAPDDVRDPDLFEVDADQRTRQEATQMHNYVNARRLRKVHAGAHPYF